MIVRVNRSYLAAAWLFLVIAIASWDALAGAKASEKTTAESSSAVTSDSSIQLSGQELWSNNCQRCHNMRSPAMYNHAQWDVIVHHMRVRANITGAEQRAIADFLKSVSPN
jgi:cytochrome c5